MDRSSAFSEFFSLLRAGSATVVLAATLSSCSDNSTAPSALSQRDPALAGVKVVVVHVPDSIKNPWLYAPATKMIGAPSLSRNVPVSRDVTAPVAAPTAPSTYTISTVGFTPEPSPVHLLIGADPNDANRDCGDCVAFHVPIGFDFTFYGNTYSELDVSSNGLIGLGAALGTTDLPLDGCCSGWGIPSNDPSAMYNNIIALAWTDWTPSSAAGVSVETQGAAPHRKLVLQWNSVPEYIPGAGQVMAQLVLSEGSNDITMYTTRMNVTNMWHMVTQGIQNADGSEAEFLPGRIQDQFVLSQDAIRFAIRPAGKPISLAPAPNVEVGTDANSCFATLALTQPTVSGGSAGLKVEGTRNDKLGLDAPYPKGVTSITWAATDAAGTTELATQTVTVADREAPQITPPANVVVGNDPGLASAFVNVGTAHVEDNCSGYAINDPANGVYPVGTSEVVWTASDEAGNTSHVTQLVTVKDVEAPVVSGVPSDLTVNATSPAGAPVLVSFSAFAHDNVGVTSFACDHVSNTTFPIGTTTVSCSAVDAAGNKSAPASFVVTVLGAPDQIVNLLEFIRGMPIPEPHRTELINALAAALSNPRSTAVACPALTLFKNSVRAKTPSVFTPEKRDQILADADRVGAVIGCP